MRDIVERLVDPRYCGQEGMRSEAAETILALRAEVDKAMAWAKEQHGCADRYAAEVETHRAALKKIAENDADGLHMYTPQAMQAVAVAALSTTEAK